MADTIIKVFDRFSDAQNARGELFASGFASSCVHLRTRQDEAGLPESHFGTGGTATVTEAVEGIFQLLTGSGARNVEGRPHQATQRGMYQLSVDVADQLEFARASAIMKRCGGADISLL